MRMAIEDLRVMGRCLQGKLSDGEATSLSNSYPLSDEWCGWSSSRWKMEM
jgi:hypothetical protein